MKKLFLLLFMVILFIGYVSARETLAILPFTGGQGDEGETIAELFSFNDRLNAIFSPIPRTSITQAIRQEQGFQMDSGMTDADTIVAIGHQLGARYVVSGNITSIGNNNLLVISIIDIRNLQQIAGDYQTYTNMVDIRNKLPNMVDNIIQATQRNTASLQKLAIVPVQLQGGADQRVADTLTQILSIHLIRSGKYTVYPRTRSLEQVMEEHRIQFSGTTADSNIVGIGFGENPNLVLSVVARRLENINMFNAAVINLFTGTQVVGRSVDYRDISDGLRAMERLAIDLTSTGEEISHRQRELEQQQRQAEQEQQRQRAQAQKVADRRARRDAFWNDERRFWSIGVNVGSMYGVPAAIGFGAIVGSVILFPPDEGFGYTLLAQAVFGIPLGFLGAMPLIYADTDPFSPGISGNINITLAPFPYSFIELGCDMLFINPGGVQGRDYISSYPYANYLFFIGSEGYEKGGFFIGPGVGRMFTITGSAERTGNINLINDRFALNLIAGGKIGKNPNYFDIRAVAGFDFNKGIYYTLLCGYSFRLNRK